MNTKKLDRSFVHISACLGIAEMENHGSYKSLINNGQLTRWKKLLREMRPSVQDRVREEERREKRRATQLEEVNRQTFINSNREERMRRKKND